jgi:predicted CopG family antitoxin
MREYIYILYNSKYTCGENMKIWSDSKIKTVRVKEDVWRELMILKFRLGRQSLNEVIEELVNYYYEREGLQSVEPKPKRGSRSE